MSERPGGLREEWATRVGENFTVESEDGATFELLECSPAVSSGGHLGFTLRFAAPAREQGIVRLSASGFEPQDVFVVPVAALGDRLEFEAVYNLVEG